MSFLRKQYLFSHLFVLFLLALRLDASYMITDLGVFSGGTSSSANGLNNLGQVVGSANDASGNARGFLWSNGILTNLGLLPGGSFSSATAINSNGDVVGWSGVTSNNIHAFLYTGGALIDLTPVSTAFGFAYGINDAGQITGEFTNANPTVSHAFRISGGVFQDLGLLPNGERSVAYGINASGQVTGLASIGPVVIDPNTTIFPNHVFRSDNGGALQDLGTLGGVSGAGRAINDKGQIVGGSANASGFGRAFLLDPMNGYFDLLTLGGQTSDAYDINEQGEVVGESRTANGSTHAFLHDGTQMLDLNDLIPSGSNWVLTRATGINDVGQIVGYGTNPNGQTRAFLLTPTSSSVPEPGTFGVVLAGLACVAWRISLRGGSPKVSG